MRGLLALLLIAAARVLYGLSWFTLFPSRWFAAGSRWCSDRASALSRKNGDDR